jgi:hypothetical protein
MIQGFDPINLPTPTGRWADAGSGSYEKRGNLFIEIVGRCKILLEGEDVTNRCFYFDEDNGIVGIHALNAEGNKYALDGDVAREWRRGKVELIIHERTDAK